MRSRPIFWFVISLLCLVGAYYFWQWGEQRAGRTGLVAPGSTNESARSPHAQFQPVSPARSPVVPVPQIQPPGVTNATPEELAAAKRAERLKYRLANTTSKIGELVHNDRAILLENALIDTAQSVALPIPDHLRSNGDPGSYIVQSCGPLNDAFRALLKEVGTEIVSYIPNNAYLVRMTASQAQQIAGRACAVLPFEPYYKLKSELLKLAVEQKPLPEDSGLNVLLFADASDTTIDQLQRRGIKIVSKDRSPFGPVLKVIPPADALAEIAGLSGVQGVELLRRRVPANDMTRVLISVAPDTTTLTNYLGLDGTGVKVNVNDGGVDATHPDLSPRVNGDALQDFDGHGTHVAGIIASSGINDTAPPAVTSVSTNASGSVTNADFRGKAPAAKILSLGVDFGTLFVSDSYLQETAANDPDNIFISNNSWGVNGENGYDLTAASYDAAVRDALPHVTGSRPLAYVFSAGNEGIGENNGQGGQPDTVSAPATAKNVIAVGATELGRFITNQFAVNGITNQYFHPMTDGTNEVASFSSRGNAGIGIEGEFGRFKPDVVAPGTFVVSTRSQQWNQDVYYNPSNTFFAIAFGITVDSGSRFDDFFFVPDNAVQMQITLTNLTSPPPLPTLPIYAKAGSVPGIGDFRGNNQITVTFPPDLNNNFWYYTVRNPWQVAVSFDVLIQIVVTNDNGALETIHQMNDKLGTLYRYESGTSMAAPAVSGMMALMQQFMEAHGGRPSPALMKAMVINGARSMEGYNFQVQNTINYQGWGLVNLTNSIPRVLADSSAYPAYTSHNPGPIQVFDQSADEALITGQSRTRTISLNNSARNQPLRISLVWTDPPGNPAAGVKLVNDLDLVVTNLVNGRIYYGNDIEAGFVSNTARDTNSFPNLDAINNVENVYIPNTLSSNYSITVIGRRVNVNAVTTNDNVAQDYALVISSGNGRTNNQITVVQDTPPPVFAETPLSTIVTNGFRDMPGVVGNTLFGQHVGASTPQLGLDTVGLPGYSTNAVITVGQTNQWHFYIFTNNLVLTNANAPTNYVAFVTFLPYTLSIPREGVFEPTLQNATREEADIDLYVSTNAAFTNLVPIEIATATKSLSRGGTEVITFTNDTGSGQVYYIGVKSEDREAAEYGFLAIASDIPFSTEDQQGVTIRGVPVPSIIPDGTPKKPGAALIFGIAVSPEKARRVLVTNDISHQLFGDLLGNLSHDRKFAVLNNHTGGNGTTNQFLIYEDNGEDVPFIPNPYILKTSDGPGNLRNFVGESIAGLWLFTVVDNAQFQVGTVERTMIRVEKQLDYGGGAGVTLLPGQLFFDSVDVPPEGVSLTFRVDNNTGVNAQPVQLFVRRDAFPIIIPNASIADDTADYAKIMFPPTDSLTIDKTSNPPLNAGRYYFGLLNPPANVAQNLVLFITISNDLNGVQTIRPTSTGFEQLLDDAVTNSTIVVTNDHRIATVDVGLRIDHPRISDLAITLVSPKGTRVLLMENRGGTTTEGAGSSVLTTNGIPTSTNGGFAVVTNIINTGQNQGTLIVDYDFENIPDRMTVYYDNVLIHDTGLVNKTNRFVVDYGPGISTDLIIVMNEGNNTDTNTIWSYTAKVITAAFKYLTFTENTNLTITPIKFAMPPFRPSTNVIPVWHSTFGSVPSGGAAGAYFPEGWHVDSGDVEVGAFAGSTPYEGPVMLDINGGQPGQVSTNINTVAGKTYRFSFAYARNPDSIGNVVPQAQILANSSLIYTVVANYTNAWLSLDWKLVSFPFTANAAVTHLVLASYLTPGLSGVMFDALDLSDVQQFSGVYLPEESLEVLKGENALGEWKLELWDNRVGAPAPADALQSWQLSFVFEDTVPRSTNTVCGGQTTNLFFTVPANATFASNVLVSATGPVNVFFNQTNATGSVPPDYQVLTLVTNGTFLLTTTPSTPFTTPPLIPGATYSITVQNPGTNCVTFVYQVNFGFSLQLPSFPGAEGPGGNAWGGRGGDVYHVVNLNDSGPGSLRYGVTNATGPRTIVFDVSGTINLLSDLKITNHFMTIAGQTAPGDGVTLQGRLTSVQRTHDVVVRFLRFRPGDSNCPSFQEDSFHFDFASNCIVDHVSASWSVDEVLSATDSTNITVQWSMITEALNDSCHPSGLHGYGSLLRYGHGSLSYHHNLYAHNYARNPRLGDNLSLDFVNNVIYNWGILPGYSENDSADNPAGFTNHLNYVGNYAIAGVDSVLPNAAFFGGSPNTLIYQSGNRIDGNQNGVLDGADTGLGMFANLYTAVPTRFDLPLVTTYDSAEAYERVLAFGGAWQNRDTVDLRLANDVRAQTGSIIDSQNDVGGWPVIASVAPFPDSDQDGMSDYWEVTFGLDPLVAGNNNDRDGDGYTDLEEFLNWLGVIHAVVLHDSFVDVDLREVTGNTGNLTFGVFNGTNGTVVLLTNGFTARFTPTAAYIGLASFGFVATNLDTAIRFGPVPVSVLVSAVTPATDYTLRIIRWEFITNSFCVTWTSIPGSNYVVQAKPNLSVTNWDTVSPVITATDIETTWCIGLPSVYHFFRVAGLALSTNQPPITNAVPLTGSASYCNTNSGVGNTNDYYLFTVSSNSVRAQFEINGPSGDMTLVLRKGTLPDLATNDYISANTYTNDELIVVLDSSSPIPLSPGDWYAGAVNVSGGPVSYCIKATEWTSTGTNITVTGSQITTNGFCVTWNSLIGAHYVVVGKSNLLSPVWDDVSPTITAVATQTIWCVSLPSPYHFFRVREGLALSTNVPPAIPPVIPVVSGVTFTSTNVVLQWSGPTNQQYQAQWATNLIPPVAWTTFTNIISSTNGQFSFIDDYSQTPPPGSMRFYRLRLYP